jgi:Kef-type K+ transport system membrane component KefB/nucleotide-binding universal stress UspA family protein
MDVFTAASHDDVLKLIIQIAVLLITARMLGEAARRLGQPSVIGELLAGIVLGPSLLSGLFPFVDDWVVPQTEVEGYLLEVVALMGAMLLLLITGLETDLVLIRRHARTAVGVSMGGIAVTFASGFMLGQYLPDSLVADPDRRLVFALFVATAMSISAIPVIAKVLMDLNLMRRDIGQTIIASGMIDDTTGWILLGIVAGLASGEAVTAGSVAQTVGSVAAFLVISFTVGRWLVKRLVDVVQDRMASEHRLLTLVVGLTFAWGAITQALDLEAVLGAFVMGAILGQVPRLPVAVHHSLNTMALGFFTPVFFAVAGLKVDITQLFDTTLALMTGLVIAVATTGKVVGTYVGARLIGRRDHWNALSYGAGLNARGAMEIIIATVGLTLGILNQEMFSILVLMAMATSLMAPTALRFVLRRVVPEEQELERLRREELAASSWTGTIRRVLLPVRVRTPGSATLTLEAHLLERLAAQSRLSVTLFAVVRPGGRAEAAEFLEELAGLYSRQEVNKRIVESETVAETIVEEASRDYELVVLGAPETSTETGVLFTSVTDYVMRFAPCAKLVVQGRFTEQHWPPRHILVPTNGAASARNAAEVAFRIAAAPVAPAETLILNVVTESRATFPDATDPFGGQLFIARQIVEELRDLGRANGVAAAADVRLGEDPHTAILDYCEEREIDLIVLGTDVRPGSSRVFLGPSVEAILKRARCPIVVVSAG